MQIKNVKVLLWDIETSPNIVTSWALHKQFIGFESILREREIIAIGWKFLGDKKTSVMSLRTCTEEEMLTKMHGLLQEADVLVHHNGNRFDLPMFNSRAIKYGLPPLPTIPSVDTLKLARKYFKFNSNKLDYLGQFLGLGSKYTTRKGLWKDILIGIMHSEIYNKILDPKTKRALREMEIYNAQDVNLLESVYVALRPYDVNHPNLGIHAKHDHVCPVCSSAKLHRRGSRVTRTGKYARFQCQDCGAWSSNGKSERTMEIR